MDVTFRKVFSERGRTLIIHRQYKFRQFNYLKSSGEQCWRCTEKRCKSKLYTLGDGEILSRIEGEHNHGPLEEKDLCRQEVSNGIKRKAKDFEERPFKMIRREISKHHSAVETLTQYDVKLIRNNIINARLKVHSKLQTTSKEAQAALGEMAPTYKLTYFDFTGVGEPIRFILSYLGVEFEDHRIPLKDWPQHKESLPFGKVPMLEIDGKQVHQSLAICRYLAKQTDLSGSDDWENLLIDMVVETFVDFRLQVARMMHETGDAKIQLHEKLKTEIAPFYMEKFDEMVKENNGYFVNGRLTWADIYVTAFSFTMQSVMGEDIFEKYPNMAELKQKVNEIPQIKAWIEKRPPSDF